MNKTLVLLLAFTIVVTGMGFCMAADENDVEGITADSLNANLQEQAVAPGQGAISGLAGNKGTIPLQKTGLPVAPALLSALLIGSGLLYEKLRK